MRTSVVEPPPATADTRRVTPPSRRGHHAWTVVGALLVLAATAGLAQLPQTPLNSYTISVAYSLAFFVAVAQSWNLMSGFTGYISFAHGALVGIGSYTAILVGNRGWDLPATIAAGAVVAAAASFLIGLPSLRLRGLAFAFATIFFQAIVLVIAEKAVPLTGGSSGLAMRDLVAVDDLLVVMALIAGAATLLVHFLRRSRVGLRLLAIREDEDAAQAIGIRTTRLKLGAFAVSSVFAGAAGAVHAYFLATVFPLSVFDIQTSVEPLVIALLGGSGSAFGPALVGGVYAVSQEALTHLGSELQLSLFGALLLLVVLFARDGVAGLAGRLADAVRRRRQGGSR